MKQTVQQRLNILIEKFPCVMIEQKNGVVYLLKEHWKHLDWRKNAERVLIGKGSVSERQFEYLTKKFTSFKRTKL